MIVFVFNTAPYASEHVYNGLRLATQLQTTDGVDVKVFLMSDSVYAAASGQKPPQYNYQVDQMVTQILLDGAAVAACGMCMDARGVKAEGLVEGVTRGSMAELAQWTLAAEKVLVF